jgi:hypothetical protein
MGAMLTIPPDATAILKRRLQRLPPASFRLRKNRKSFL